MTSRPDTPLILFGAFDRHNFGDLLLAHVAAARHQARPLVFAGVAERDLRPWGGHQVQAISRLARAWGNQLADVHHVGGEVLTCSLYDAAVMVLPRDEATHAIARYDEDPVARQAWATAELGLDQQVAYLVPKTLFHNPGQFTYQAIGGVDLPRLPASMQTEVRARMAVADKISVRDRITQGHLASWGIQAPLEPDPGEQVAALFGPTIARHAESGEPSAIRDAFPQGYLAMQFSADFGDDATLQTLAGQWDRITRETGLGLCLFQAGAAPWHDDAALYRRLMGLLEHNRVRLFGSLHLWDICALLSQARAYCGSSLHGRIVAHAFGVPGISLIAQASPAMGKVRAYGETWWHDRDAGLARPGEIYSMVRTILAQ